MELSTVMAFFQWCTLLNGSLLLLWAAWCVFAPDLLYRMQTRWFPMSRETFNVVTYAFLGVFKLFFVVFNLVPFLALSILI